MIWLTHKSINPTKKSQTYFMSRVGRQVAPLSQFPQWPCHRHPFNPAQWSEISPSTWKSPLNVGWQNTKAPLFDINILFISWQMLSTWKSPLNVGWQTTKAPLFDINILFISWQKQLQALPGSHDWLVKISCLKSVQIGTYLLLAWNSLWCTAWAAFAFLSFEFSHNPEFVFPGPIMLPNLCHKMFCRHHRCHNISRNSTKYKSCISRPC